MEKPNWQVFSFLEVQMRKLQNEISVYQTARNAYVAALKAELAKAS